MDVTEGLQQRIKELEAELDDAACGWNAHYERERQLQADMANAVRENTELAMHLQNAKKLISKLTEDNKELSRKCKEHYDNCQKLLRYELKVTEGERVVNGKINGGATFKLQ